MANRGRIVWYELLSTDPAGSRTFYPEVVGWTTEAWGDGGYTMWVGSQGPLGGVSDLPAAARAMGAPSFWQCSVQVDDVDASIAKVTELGGKVHHVETVPTVGRLAVIADPQGAVLSLFTPEREMAAHDRAQPGEFQWHELMTTDPEAALAFYGTIAGWEPMGVNDMGAMGPYLLWGREGRQLGGMMRLPPGAKAPDGRAVPPSWMYYVTVADLDAALARATERGARVIMGPMAVPTGQRVVLLLDPQGAAFALTEPPR
ncbi:MAG: VOC family protein [Kofleriaceae bacterium]